MLMIVDCGLCHITQEEIRESLMLKATEEEETMLKGMDFGVIVK